jgi:hypothetical protein
MKILFSVDIKNSSSSYSLKEQKLEHSIQNAFALELFWKILRSNYDHYLVSDRSYLMRNSFINCFNLNEINAGSKILVFVNFKTVEFFLS